jgi:hypothetical protein
MYHNKTRQDKEGNFDAVVRVIPKNYNLSARDQVIVILFETNSILSCKSIIKMQAQGIHTGFNWK